MIVGGTPPDTMELHPAWVLNFILANQLNDLTDRMKTDKAAYIPAQLDFWSHQSKLYGMPYYSGPSFIFYNKTLFKKHGAKTPEEHEKAGTWTWDTLQELAKKATTGSGAEKTFGWDAAQHAANLQFYTCVPIWCNGGELINKEETAWLLDTPPVVEVIQWHADMVLKDKSDPAAERPPGAYLAVPDRAGRDGLGRALPLDRAGATPPFEVGMVGTPKGKAGPVNRDGPNATRPADRDEEPRRGLQAGDVLRRGRTPRPIYLASGRPLPVRNDLLDSDAFKKSLKPFERLEVLLRVRPRRSAPGACPGKGAEARPGAEAEWDKVLVGQQDVPTAMKAAKAAMDPLLKVRLGGSTAMAAGRATGRTHAGASARRSRRLLRQAGDRRVRSASCPG